MLRGNGQCAVGQVLLKASSSSEGKISSNVNHPLQRIITEVFRCSGRVGASNKPILFSSLGFSVKVCNLLFYSDNIYMRRVYYYVVVWPL